MEREELIEVLRMAYLEGVSDKEEGNERWCFDGSKERATELITEYVADGCITCELQD